MILSNNMKTIPSLKGQRLNSLNLILLAVTSLLIASCAAPYDQYTVQEVQTSSKGTTSTSTRPITIINVRRSYYRPAYVTPGYHSYGSYYGCGPSYYRRYRYQRQGTSKSQGCPREKVCLERPRSIDPQRSRLLIYRGNLKRYIYPWV